MTDDEREMLHDLLELDHGLSPREVDFIEDLSHRQERGLTDKQWMWLRKLWEKHCET